jgi:hypothetical protein
VPTENRQRLFGNWTQNWMAIATVASAPNPRADDPRPTQLLQGAWDVHTPVHMAHAAGSPTYGCKCARNLWC